MNSDVIKMEHRFVWIWTVAFVCLWLSGTTAEIPITVSSNSDELIRRLELVEKRSTDQERIIQHLLETTNTQNTRIDEQDEQVRVQNEQLRVQNEQIRVLNELTEKQEKEIVSLKERLITKSQDRKDDTKHPEDPSKPSAVSDVRKPSSARTPGNKRLVLDNLETQIAFHARIDKGAIAHISITQILVFDITVLNNGGGYHNSSGIFTAPTPGLYFFSLSVCILHTGKDIHAEVMKNGLSVAGAYANGNDQGSVSVIVPLVTGDEVWVSSLHHPDTYLYGDTLTSFTGFMLANY